MLFLAVEIEKCYGALFHKIEFKILTRDSRSEKTL